MHTPEEIIAGLKPMRELIAGRPIILAAHDWTPENETTLRQAFPIGGAVRYDSLFVCELLPE
jgi:hypothetical protein